MAEHLNHQASVFDLDDTLIGRGRTERVFGLAKGKVRPYRPSGLSAADIAKLQLNHNRVSEPIRSLEERISLIFHARRSVYQGVRDEFERITANGRDIYGNTGRSHKGEWVDMTEETLRRGGITAYLRRVFYTPEDSRASVSKAHAIQELASRYDGIEFYDDDPRTALFIARLFPNVNVNLVQHGLTGMLVSRQEMETFPNLRRVAVFGKR
ncbi:MAG: hypothetical protein M1372_00870 [Patescibacteria group bacterium]|nr:hypothetical protein [Patescibacteria group bacterium]